MKRLRKRKARMRLMGILLAAAVAVGTLPFGKTEA